MSVLSIVLSVLLSAGAVPAMETPPFAYHLRVVRVSPSTAVPGAALGWAPNGGAPVILPSDEAWGTPEQMQALADALGGDRAEPVTGYYVLAGADGVMEFVRKVYVGESVHTLTFRAVPPATRRSGHDVDLSLAGEGERGAPIAEAKVRIATDRTVAIAVPGETAGDWVVLGLTPLEPSEAAEGARRSLAAETLEGGDIVMPRLIRKVEPSYPRAARAEGVTGKIVLNAIVDREGVPRAPTILSMPPGTEELAGSAVEAVQKWRYEPATRNGEPISVYYTIVIQFRLK